MKRDQARSERTDMSFQLEVLSLQLEHERKAAEYSSFFAVGATFEVFSLTVGITGLLLAHGLPLFWICTIGVYLLTGVGFITYSTILLHRLRKREQAGLAELRKKFT